MIPTLKRAAAIHDLSGFGRCSLTAAMPILTAMGLHCCPMPTAILSNQTGYMDFTYLDFTSQMPAFIDRWEALGITFDLIYSGFLGSVDQIDIVIDFIRRFRRPDTLVAVDPVMGDNGAKYPTFSDEMCAKMKNLVRHADIVFPNVTEASLLTGTPLPAGELSVDFIDKVAAAIAQTGPQQMVITGVARGDSVCNYVYDFHSGEHFTVCARFNHQSYSGTGDIFASVVCGSLTRGESLLKATEKATRFIEKAVDFTDSMGTDTREGILFEQFIGELV